MAQQTLGIGIIGAGNIIKRHALAHRAFPDLSRLVGVADIDLKRATRAKENFGFEHAFGNHKELLDRGDVDVIDICTPANHHTRLVVEAIEAGKHVLCEKPMTITLAEADEIIAAAERRPELTVSFVFQLRSDPTFRRIRMMIEQGLIGKVVAGNVMVHLRKKPAYYTAVASRGSWKGDGGGVLINQAIHQLDALISFLGEPVEVSSVMGTFVQPIEAEDTINGWVRFASGAIATIDCTVCAQSKTFAIGVVGENAGLQVGGNPDADSFNFKIKAPGSAAQKALTNQGKKLSPQPVDPGSLTIALQKMSAKIGRKPWTPPAHWGHAPFVGEFLRAARNGEPGPVPPREARRSLELTLALYESALAGTSITLPLDSTSRVYHGVDPQKMKSAGETPARSEPRGKPVPMSSGARAGSVAD